MDQGGETVIRRKRGRLGRAMPVYVAASAALHVFLLVMLTRLLIFRAAAPSRNNPPEIVAISSAARITHRVRPLPAHAVTVRRPVVRYLARPERSAQARRVTIHQRREMRVVEMHVVKPHAPPQNPAHRDGASAPEQIDAQTRAFERTIAAARAAADPVAGAARSVTPETPKRLAMNISGSVGAPQPEGVLYPIKRWMQGPYVYYYVRYLAEYADGSTETGVVPWPIRYPIDADPFARGVHRMPLPGPMEDYVATSDVQMQPLVKNCYDHRYDYCPIAHE